MGWCQKSSFEVAFGSAQKQSLEDPGTQHLCLKWIQVLQGMILWLQNPNVPVTATLRCRHCVQEKGRDSKPMWHENLTLPIQLFFCESKPSNFLCGLASSLWSYV